ncbi:facilitated trehalose transporter Tret1-like isoform X2 [Euwallacea fornicatus]|uniref:facilitated trehalose transporter Tret1-like isoform X2 n=1 Tax=Euwallacea fornicatus TaxID=995702 RepID=UPI003390550A
MTDLQHLGILEVLLGTLMAVSDGMTYGWTSPMIPYFKSNQTHIEVTDKDCEWMETIVLFGASAGLPFTILGVNYLGRKKCMIISAAVGCICWIMILVGKSLAVIFVARFFSGMAGDMCFVAAPMYIAEIADHRFRGFLSAMIYLMMLVGMLLVYTVGSLTPFIYVPIIGIVLTLVQVIFFPLMPESPYYLVYTNKNADAKKSLVRLRGADSNIDREILEIEKAVERQKTDKGRPQDLVLIKSNRRALLIMLILNGAQHFVGISVVFMNLHVILNEAGSVYMKTSTAAIVFAVILLISASVASAIIDKFGRKVLLILSGVLTGAVLLVIAVYFHLKNVQYDVTVISWIPAVCIMIYAATFKLGLGLVPIVVTAEIFPTTIKAIGMTIADVIYVIASIISIVIYTSLYENYGMHAPFYLFGISSFLAVFFVYFGVPETKGKTLDEIQLMLKGIKPEDFESQYKSKEINNPNAVLE